MMQTTFFRNFLVRFSSLLSIVFLSVGLIFLFALHFGAVSNSAVGFPILSGGAMLAIFSLIAANYANIRE